MEKLKQRLTLSPLLASVPGLTHGFTNKKISRDELLELDHQAAIGKQVHGDLLIWADKPENRLREADAVATFQTGLLLGTSSADCAPVLTAALDSKGQPFAAMAVHAGWRGTALNVAGKTLRNFIAAAIDRNPNARFVSAIGPCIGPTNFEVGQEVIDAFPGCMDRGLARFLRSEEGRQKYLFNLPGENQRQIEEVAKELRVNLHVEALGHCTFEREAESLVPARRAKGRPNIVISSY
jgi:copper oxidase (laccase) domain-containing protein